LREMLEKAASILSKLRVIAMTSVQETSKNARTRIQSAQEIDEILTAGFR